MHRFSVTAIVNYMSYVAYLNLIHLHLAPPLGMTPFEFRRDLWQQKTTVPGLSCGVICVILGLAVLTQ